MSGREITDNGREINDGENSLDELTVLINEKNESSLIPLLEDLCEWLSQYMNLKINPDNFFQQLDNGFIVLKLAEKLQRHSVDYIEGHFLKRGRKTKLKSLPKLDCHIHCNAKKESFFARENAEHFIKWCRRIGIKDSTLFESEGLVLHKQLKNVVLTLLELGRVGSKFDLSPIPSLIKLEKEIEEEEAGDMFKNVTVRKPKRIKTLDLDAKVLQSAKKYNVTLVKLKDGKYSVNGKTNVFVRELRNHIMVRVGGGWDELDHFLSRHDLEKIGKILVSTSIQR